MMNKLCVRCRNRKVCQDEMASWFFIIIGFISTVSIRIVTFLMEVNPLYGKIAWYIGVGGFVIFFVYKYKVFQERSKVIDQKHLLEKVNAGQEFSHEDREIIANILCKIRSNEERVNFFFIFVVSAIALIWAVYFDFIAR